MVAYVGGFVAQEVLKACSGKFHPLVQHLYVDSLESLPDSVASLPESEFAPTNSRYDGQIAVVGRSFQQKIANARQFLVGSGAIGCEMLKNWSMMGLGSGPQGISTSPTWTPLKSRTSTDSSCSAPRMWVTSKPTLQLPRWPR